MDMYRVEYKQGGALKVTAKSYYKRGSFFCFYAESGKEVAKVAVDSVKAIIKVESADT